MLDLIIKNGQCYISGKLENKDIAVKDGKILKIGKISEEAKETYARFLDWCKKGTFIIFGCLLIVASCNFGVEEGNSKTGSQYNGEQYDPYNLNKDE